MLHRRGFLSPPLSLDVAERDFGKERAFLRGHQCQPIPLKSVRFFYLARIMFTLIEHMCVLASAQKASLHCPPSGCPTKATLLPAWHEVDVPAKTDESQKLEC